MHKIQITSHKYFRLAVDYTVSAFDQSAFFNLMRGDWLISKSGLVLLHTFEDASRKCVSLLCIVEIRESCESHSPLLMTTLAPSLPRIPRSCGFGLCPLPFFLPKNESMPPEGFAATSSLASAGKVASCFASSDQLPISSKVTCIPPLVDSFRVPVGR